MNTGDKAEPTREERPAFRLGCETLHGRDFIHGIPRVPVVDRVDTIMELARGRRVIHVGFVDSGLYMAKRERGTWLHERLASVATQVVGIDTDEQGVRLAHTLGFEAYVADCQESQALAALRLKPAELVLAGEVIEHLDRPGAFLRAMTSLVQPSGLLAITTPNAMALTNFAFAAVRREVVSPDHVAWYSRQTMLALLARHDWSVRAFAYYLLPRQEVSQQLGTSERLLVRAWNAFRVPARVACRLLPGLADGLIVLASPPTGRGARIHPG